MPNLIQKLFLLSFCLIELNSLCSTLFFQKGLFDKKEPMPGLDQSLTISLPSPPKMINSLMISDWSSLESRCDCNLRKHFYFFFAGIVKLNVSCPRSQDCTKWCSQWSIFAGDLVVVPCIHSHQQTHIQYPKTQLTSHVFCQGKYSKFNICQVQVYQKPLSMNLVYFQTRVISLIYVNI